MENKIIKDLSFLQRYAEWLMKKNNSNPLLGLWDGKMGIAITFFHLSGLTKNKMYEIEANNMIDEVYNSLTHNIAFDFANGLLGIGCGFEYIINKGFAEGDSDEILSEIDAVVRSIIDGRPIDSLDIGEGVCGVGYYLYCRLRNKKENDEILITLRLKEYLIYLIDWIEELLMKTNKTSECNDVYFLLCRFQKLDVFNFKVNRLITLCLQKMMEGDCGVQDHYELMGIQSLKLLKPWI